MIWITAKCQNNSLRIKVELGNIWKEYDKAKGAKHKKSEAKFKGSPFADILRETEGRITGGLHKKGAVSASARQYAEDPLAAKSIELGYNDDTVVVARMLQ